MQYLNEYPGNEKNLISKAYTLYDFGFIIFLRRYNFRNSEQISNFETLRREWEMTRNGFDIVGIHELLVDKNVLYLNCSISVNILVIL